MKYEWDENKRKSNLEKHGLDFVIAYKIYEAALVIDKTDDRLISIQTYMEHKQNAKSKKTAPVSESFLNR